MLSCIVLAQHWIIICANWENFILLGDFNSEISENALKEFCDKYNLKNLVTETTCFKNPLNPSSIDLILTNRDISFQNSITMETGLSDHHKMIITVLKTLVPKQDSYINQVS